MRTNLMFSSIMISEFTALSAKVFLHQGIDDDFFTDGMASDLPGELADPT
jgi:hypothetical protein